ncbi:hypothetical protein HanPSC8_Chr14g0627851 [Helianthus annuus]|nr:hypothetical protein HanPSC8_Chr14g0627851 [Helianthus annuus]
MKREGRQHGVVRSYPILPTPLSRSSTRCCSELPNPAYSLFSSKAICKNGGFNLRRRCIHQSFKEAYKSV